MKNTNLSYVIILLLLAGNLSFPQQQKLNIYGFFDFRAEVNNKDGSGKKWTFDQNILNVLANYNLDERFRVATEIEWDHSPVHSPGEIALEVNLAKAFLEYKYSDAFLARVGRFLSPFGIYNERHEATPTFISALLPQSVYGKKNLSPGVSGRLFAKYSTGIQILGNLFKDDWGLKYQLYLSNGRGSDKYGKDINVNKGLGGRFVVSPPVEELRIGTSFYTDKNGNSNNARQTTIGLDVEYDLSSAHLEAEYIIPKLEKIDTAGIPTGNFRHVSGYYILGAYTFFNTLTPFVRYEFFDPDLGIKSNSKSIVTFGINYSITASVYLKAELHAHRFQDKSLKRYEVFVSSLAVAF